ncbi:endonuclease III [Nitrospirales bacterium NOB]|nr:endonuclease III [Nitrospira sp. NTP2]MCK6493723.1 endonuclease III [Nitrospira sp.]MDL1889334.1 endonuclease III [Nitrospirales bacterium NOB]MEB2337687.1 endonuclease III [Nitrospirales bacterium]MCK6500002.1 endonuclease III [Nitrospira sp.]
MNKPLSPQPAERRNRTRVAHLLETLRASMPVYKVELDHHTPWELLVATILSAQCTDQRVNQVTPQLFRRYRRPRDFAQADPVELEALIRSTGFYKAKARSLIRCAKVVTDTFHEQVPDSMEALTTLPGVGRKTANVILGNAFGKPAVVVDTHVKRVSGRLGLSRQTDPDKIEMDLRRLLPEEHWTEGSQRLLLHGRYVCLARAPKCGTCPIYADCGWKGKLTR